MNFIYLFFIITILFYFYDFYFPPIWPDEVLFSSPASQLANHFKFNTEVLSGIIYGMDKATLWMSPLYMVLLSIIYKLFGESLFAGRFFSLFTACIATLIFYYIIKHIINNKKLAFFISLLLILDLSFSRATNIIRMEMLNLTFILISILFMELRKPILTGIFMGLAGLTHPISIFLIPIVFIYYRFSTINLIKIAISAFVVMIPWFIYILNYSDIFVFQFLAQITRKSTHYNFEGLLYLLKVFGGQYQHKWNVILIYIFILMIFILFIYDLLNKKYTIKYILIFLTIFGTTLLSSEAWYSIYPLPFALIYLSIFIYHYDSLKKYLLIFSFFIFIMIHFFFWNKYFAKIFEYKKEYNNWIQFLNKNIQPCRTIFLQTIPDPYFHLPRNKSYKEFPPYGLFQNKYFESYLSTRIETYQKIDCFIISNQEPVEPALDEILKSNTFQIIPYPKFSTLPEGNIYIKIK